MLYNIPLLFVITGHSCPYCVIKMDSTVYRTKIVRLTPDPVFNEHFVLYVCTILKISVFYITVT